jgi:hypothetical protein
MPCSFKQGAFPSFCAVICDRMHSFFMQVQSAIPVVGF